jgi:salicylate hydroxylase
MALRVGIAGAGIGGLTLAHALRHHGIEPVVHDRDRGPGDTAGYHLHLTPEAVRTLVRVLPPTSVQALRDNGAGNEAFTRFTVLDHRGHARVRLPMTHEGEVLMIGRRPLREILSRGLRIRWDSPVRRIDAFPDDAGIDLLVAADGTNSRLAHQLIGRPTARPAGITGIAGRALLPQRIPAGLRHGPAFVIGPGGVGAFLSLQAKNSAEAAHVIWTVAAPAVGPDLRAEAHRLTRSWNPGYHALIAASEPGSVAAFSFHFPAALRPWPIGRVTLLGDAIHPMPPTAGAGASTAILDAAHLAADLARHPLPEALATYQSRLLTYAPAAVAESLPSLTWQRRLANPLLRTAATDLVFPLADAVLRAFRRRP